MQFKCMVYGFNALTEINLILLADKKNNLEYDKIELSDLLFPTVIPQCFSCYKK